MTARRLDPNDPLHALLLCIVVDTFDRDRTGDHARVSWDLIRRSHTALVAAGIDGRVLDLLESYANHRRGRSR